MTNTKTVATSPLQAEIEAVTGINLDSCMQCGTCTGGCSGIEGMDFSPRQMIQLIKANERDRVLKSKTIWSCQSCHICDDRCPAKIQTSAYMDALRHMAYAEGVGADAPQSIFHGVYLDQIKKYGRTHEMLMMAQYMLKAKGALPITMGAGLNTMLHGRIDITERPHTPGAKFKVLVKKLEEGSKKA
jgi:heterodisulfide reductase subunit C